MKPDYIQALLWSSSHYDENDIDIPFDQVDAELSKELDLKIEEECASFLERAEKLLDRINPSHDATSEQIGHDFALTRNGHGVGFWDRPEIYGERCSKLLTALSHRYDESSIHLGDDGLIYD